MPGSRLLSSYWRGVHREPGGPDEPPPACRERWTVGTTEAWPGRPWGRRRCQVGQGLWGGWRRLRASRGCREGALPGAGQPEPLALCIYRDAPSLSTQAAGTPKGLLLGLREFPKAGSPHSCAWTRTGESLLGPPADTPPGLWSPKSHHMHLPGSTFLEGERDGPWPHPISCVCFPRSREGNPPPESASQPGTSCFLQILGTLGQEACSLRESLNHEGNSPVRMALVSSKVGETEGRGLALTPALQDQHLPQRT